VLCCVVLCQVYCSGQTVVTAKKYPMVDVQWVDALLASSGYPIRYLISDFSINETDAPYLDADISDLYIAVYKTDMLENQENCDYMSFDGGSDVNFYDYIHLSAWDGLQKNTYVTTTTATDPPITENYIVSNFGGKYKLVVWLWRKTLIGMDSPYMLASTDIMRVPGPATLDIDITQGSSGEHIEGTFSISGTVTRAGDYLVLYALNERGR
jgi:hypothetical protein